MDKSFEGSLKNFKRGEWVRLSTLTYLRWLAVVGQSLAVIIGYFLLKLNFSIFGCFFLILLSSLLNLISGFYFPKTKRLPEFQNMLLLLILTLSLTMIL